MSILSTEIKMYKSAQVNDTGSNGGRMSAVVSTSNVKNNLWPDIPQAERAAGSSKYRKLHVKVDNSANLTLQDTKIYVENYTPGDDAIVIFPGTNTDIQSGLTGSERKYGSGQLDSDISASATSLSVATEGAAYDYFQNGDMIRISDKTDINDTGGNEEYLTITSVPSYGADVATFNVTATANAYVAVDTRVASVIQAGLVESSYATFAITSASGTYDDTTYPIVVPNISSVEQDWTLTFTSSTAFDVTGNTLAAVGSGTISTDTQPNNSDYALPYFDLLSAGFGGTWATSDTITFTTHPATYPIWYYRDVPAAAAALTGNQVVVVVDGEST